jgi:Zn-finger nucleic acid-binding protein
MTDVAPFREAPRFVLCPRCGEMLERAFEAVRTCLRCEGLWIATVTVERAFGDPRWPRGPSMWWRNALECPDCAAEGTVQTMTAVQAGDVVVDRCAAHGVWLDRTELFRLMGGGDPGAGGLSPDLAALRAQLEVPDADLEQLARKRETWRDDAGARRRAAQEYRAWLEAEQRRRQDEAVERERAERAREQREEATREAEAKQAEARKQAAREAAEREVQREAAARERAEREAAAREARRMEAARERRHALQELEDARKQAAAEVGGLETQLMGLRAQVRTAEAQLGGARVRLRAVMDRLEELKARPQ